MINIRELAKDIDTRTLAEVSRLAARGEQLRVADVIASDDEAVLAYVKTKRAKAQKLGIYYEVRQLEPNCSMTEVQKLLENLDRDPAITGIMVSAPTYAHLNIDELLAEISPQKDVDGLSPLNVAHLASNEEHLALAPATALAAMHIIEQVTSLRGRNLVVLGRGRTVGRPVAQMAVNRDATVTICHSRTQEIDRVAQHADILVSAIGRPDFVTASFSREQQIVVDCGISIVDEKVVGDVSFIEVSKIAAYVTPVPGGVGVLTNSFLFGNLLKAYALQR
jgi:methylenetetrahydrofolate dehydrogenase (NADP+) / methenyltetrahydrofolate cyclohydrolase